MHIIIVLPVVWGGGGGGGGGGEEEGGCAYGFIRTIHTHKKVVQLSAYWQYYLSSTSAHLTDSKQPCTTILHNQNSNKQCIE